MKKILILSQCLRKSLDGILFETIEQTWGKYAHDIEIPLYGYAAMTDREKESSPHSTLGFIDAECKTVLVPYKDDLLASFNRTISTLRTLVQKVNEADYILLTNTSTYVNVPLLYTFVQSLSDNDMRVYCGRVIASEHMSAPYGWLPYAEGSAILLSRVYVHYLINNFWRNCVVKNDMNDCGEEWKLYRRNVWDTAIGNIINELLLEDYGNRCLHLDEITDYNIRLIGNDCTKFWQDWGQDKYDKADRAYWPLMMTIDCRQETDEETAHTLREVHERMKEYYKEYDIDMRYVQEYINSPQTPVVTMSLDKPDCCLDDYEKLPFDDYHKWLEENTDIPNLESDENGNMVEDGTGISSTSGQKKPCHKDERCLTYAQYFNIPFWNHQCWYRHPWAGDNFCGCCQQEQLVYPGGSPSHQHKGPEPDCGCGCHHHHHHDSGCGCGSHHPSSEPDKDTETGCDCFKWTEIKD